MEVNAEGDLIHVGSGDPAWRTVTENGSEFPMSAKDVASHMNRAFRVGADAKLAEIRSVLELDYHEAAVLYKAHGAFKEELEE